MACLGAVLYDPASIATDTTTAALAMTAFDTTNARITFTAPDNGIVLVKLRVAHKGGTNVAALLGVLDGATVRGRQSPFQSPRSPAVANLRTHEVVFPVTGLTPTTSYTFDAAYGVETLLASSQFGWGGPNNATASDAYGALSFEIWETANLLGAIQYDPAAAVSKATSALLALTALDTTNLRIAFTVPASGRVMVRLRGTIHGATSCPTIHLGVLESSTVKMRAAAINNFGPSAPAATDHYPVEACAVIPGLTPSASLTWDAAYAVETVTASSNLKYGGPNNTTANDAFGGFTYEVWAA
jgi:hypothetical protein